MDVYEVDPYTVVFKTLTLHEGETGYRDGEIPQLPVRGIGSVQDNIIFICDQSRDLTS